jgi:hypothetical protein
MCMPLCCAVVNMHQCSMHTATSHTCSHSPKAAPHHKPQPVQTSRCHPPRTPLHTCTCRHPQAQAAGESAYGLEFMEPCQSPSFTYEAGRNSPYGEQSLVLLRSLSCSQGLSCRVYAEAFSSAFGEGYEGYRDVSTKVGVAV